MNNLKFKMELLREENENLFWFIGEANRLSAQNKSFIFGFQGGNKLYLETCKGIQKKAYACVEKNTVIKFISLLNYSVALLCRISVSLESQNVICFQISGSNLDKVVNFSKDLSIDPNLFELT